MLILVGYSSRGPIGDANTSGSARSHPPELPPIAPAVVQPEAAPSPPTGHRAKGVSFAERPRAGPNDRPQEGSPNQTEDWHFDRIRNGPKQDSHPALRRRSGCSRARSLVRTWPNNRRKGDNLRGNQPARRRNRRKPAETASRCTSSSDCSYRFASGQPNRSCRHHNHTGGDSTTIPPIPSEKIQRPYVFAADPGVQQEDCKVQRRVILTRVILEGVSF